MPGFTLWGRTLSTRSTFIWPAKGKRGCLLLKQVLVSAGNDCSRDITEGKELTDWTAVGSSVSDIKDFMEYVFNGPWHEGLLRRITNSKRVLHNVELHRDVRLLYKHLQLWNNPDMFFFRPMWNHSLRNATCKPTAQAVFLACSTSHSVSGLSTYSWAHCRNETTKCRN